MSKDDRIRWNDRYSIKSPAIVTAGFPLPLFSSYADQFPTNGVALELACGKGEVMVWFAQRGMSVCGVDISSTAIDLAQQLAVDQRVSSRAAFEVFDLDNGLPDMPPVDLLVCQNFRNPRLYNDMQCRLVPNGLLAIVTLSEVGASPGRFRAKRGELDAAFSNMEILCSGEKEGRAWLLGRKKGTD